MNSFFRFQITQTVEVLLYKIEQGDGKRWIVEDTRTAKKKGTIILRDVDRPDNYATISVNEDVMTIRTSYNAYEYRIMNLLMDGAQVYFAGPVNALLAQSLMPRLRYVPQTLVARTSEMPEYVSIVEFMEDRARRNANNPNPQDRKGYKVNARFCNELAPYLPEAHGLTKPRRRQKK